MKRMMRLAVVLAAVMLIATACGSDESSDTTTTAAAATTTTMAAADYNLVTDGTLTVCTDAPYPPMEIEVDGEYTGFDIELMRAIADDLGLGLTVVNSGFDGITSGLAMEAGECDIAASSITITPDREENIDFGDPYFVADQSLLVKKDSGLTTLSDFADGRNLGVQSGTTGELYANENNPGATIVSYENPGDLFTALDAGAIDGILQDIVPNAAQALDDDTIEVVETYPTAEEYGFATQETGKEALLAAVNASLQKMRDNGTYDEIYNEWF
jgi:polar amino acid transport system substrate-binding protein